MLRGEFDPPARLFDVSLTFNPRALEDHLHNVGREMSRFGRQLASLQEEVNHLKSATGSMAIESSENFERMNKMLTAHDSQLKVMQQTTAMNVTSMQFNSSLTLVREQIKGLELQVAKFEGPNSKKSLEILEAAVDEYVTKWYRTNMQKDLDTREVRSQEFTRTAVEREVTTLSTTLDHQLQAINKQLASLASLDQLRSFTEMTKDRVKHESDRVEERLQGFVAAAERSNRDVAESLAQMDQRLLHMASRVGPLVAYDEGGNFAASRPITHSPSASVESLPRPTTLVASIDVNSALASTNDTNQTLFILKSPAFTVFRQQVTEDIRARLGIAKNETAAEADDQLHDVRVEVKQRTTPERVIELIKQHQDVTTPAAVAELTQVVQKLEQNKVSHADFVEGLRAKGDLHLVEQKADTFAVQEAVGVLQSRIERLESTMAVHQSEREEFRDVLRDVVYMHKRAQVIDGIPGASGGTNSPRAGSRNAKSTSEALPTVLPAITPLSGYQVPRPPHGDVDPRMSGQQSSMSARSGKGSSTPGGGGRSSKAGTPGSAMKPAVVEFPPPAQQQSRQSPLTSNAATKSGAAQVLSASQRAYNDQFGAPLMGNDAPPSGWSTSLREPGDRETMPYKSELTLEPTRRKEGVPAPF